MTLAPARPVESEAPVVLGAWRRLAVRCAIVPSAVLVPLATLAPTADHQFNVYWHGATVRSNPWTLVTENLRTVPMYLDFGNFRPLGRMLEWSADVVAYLLVELLRLPTEIALRAVSMLAAIVMTGAVVVFAEAVTARGRMFAGPPGRPLALLPFAVAGCLVAAGGTSTTVLFGGLYFLSTALVLLVAAWICRTPSRAAAVLAVGAALAAVNEIAALAPPLATLAALVRGRLVSGEGRAGLLRRAWPAGLLWLGFLPVFVPVRLLVGAACRDGGCYRGSDVLAGADAVAALPHRLAAWLPPLQWTRAVAGADRPSTVVLLLAVVAFALLAWRTVGELGRLPGLDRRQAAGLAAAGAAVLLLGATLGALGERGQQAAQAGHWGLGWRDSGLTAAGGALLVAGLLGLRGSVPVHRLSTAGLALTAAVSAAANQAYAGQANLRPAALVHTAIAAEIARFEPSAAGDARRCALRDRFAALTAGAGYSRFAAGELPGTRSPAERLDVTLDMASVQMHGEPFCRRSM